MHRHVADEGVTNQKKKKKKKKIVSPTAAMIGGWEEG